MLADSAIRYDSVHTTRKNFVIVGLCLVGICVGFNQ